MNPQQLSGLIVPVAFLAVMYFLLIRPQQKRDKELKDMRNNLEVGDEIVTIGALVGKILKITEDNIVVEVGADKTKLTFEKWGIAKVVKK